MADDTAILFNHKDGTAKLVPYDGELETLYSLLDVDLVDTIRLDSNHSIYHSIPCYHYLLIS